MGAQPWVVFIASYAAVVFHSSVTGAEPMFHERDLASAYRRSCCICARIPVCTLGKVTPVTQLSQAPMPAKLFCAGVSIPPAGNVNHPVSTIDCANAMSPRTPASWPSLRYRDASCSSGMPAR